MPDATHRLLRYTPHTPHTPRRRLFILGLALSVALLVSSCVQAIQPPTPPAPSLAPSLADASRNRLLVLGEDGNVFTIKPDGANQFWLTDDASTEHFYAQPTWSPTGDRIAWAEINSQPGEARAALLTATANGSGRTRTDLLYPPFYLHWSPDGAQVAYLSNWLGAGQQTIALRLLDVAGGAVDGKTLGVGQPFYFSWSPDSTQLLTHVANRRLGLLALDGKETVISDRTASFAAPQWSSDGRLLYGIRTENTPQLVLADASGAVEQVITFFQGDVRTAFSLSPSGNLVAYTETDAPVSVNSFGPLFLADLVTDEFEQLSVDPVIAFFWSPAGDHLLFMSAAFEGRQPWLRLHLWDGQQTRDLGRYIPSGIFFNQYLPFSDQYAQNMRFWAPDGSAFVYTGEGENGRRGVWVRHLDASEPRFVTEGVLASWSPR
jgi:TolB protein